MPSVEAPEFIRPAFASLPISDSLEGGREAVELAARYGLVLDPWQAWAVEQALAEDAAGKSSAFEVGIIVPRQNGKGAILEALTLAWLFLAEVELVLWSAHEFKTAQEAFRRMRTLLQGAKDLWSLMLPPTTAKGNEGIELTTGQRLKFVARSQSSGRGFTGDKIILDEAYDLNADEIAAMIPTLTTVEDPQIVYTSSAGRGDSEILRSVRDRGRSGSDPSLCWLEWCAPENSCKSGDSCRHSLGSEGCALDRDDFQAMSNPALNVRPSFTEERLAKFRRVMPPAEFGREYLGWWDPPLGGEQPIPVDAWVACAADRRRPADAAPTFFLDVSPGMKSASIAVCFDVDGVPHVELAEYGPGSGWLVDRAVKLAERYSWASFTVEGQGAVGALLPALAERGIEPETYTAGDMGRAAGHLQKLVGDRQVTHSDDQLFLTALAGAVKRDVGEGLWAWGRRKSTTDISPLVAVTGALWAHVNSNIPAMY